MTNAVNRRSVLHAIALVGLGVPALAKAAAGTASPSLKRRRGVALSLAATWERGDGARPHRHTYTLRNHGAAALEEFSLVTTGPIGLDIHAVIQNGSIKYRQGENSVIAPPTSGLGAGSEWQFVVEWPSSSRGIFHWTDSAHAAYAVFSDGSVANIVVEPCRPIPDVAGEPLLGVAASAEAPATGAGLSIVPWPAEVQRTGQRRGPFRLALPEHSVARTFADLVGQLFPGESLLAKNGGGFKVGFRSDPALAAEGYELHFAPEGVTVAASGDTGLLYGLVTLGQIVRGATHEPHLYVVPATGTILDKPAHAWRGCMLDVSRRFFSVNEVRRLFALMAWNKLNRFHWHLSDDEGWRPEIAAYPALTDIAAWRGQGLPIPAFCGSGADRYGGFYSRADMADIVALGTRLGIEVIPEIDMPGHSFATRVALPQLADPAEQGSDVSIQKFSHNVLNPGLDVTYQFVETVIGELTDIFPSRYFHIGGDEVPDQAWARSPAAGARLKAIGGTTTADLQSHFSRQVQAMVKSHGRNTCAWEEAAGGPGLDRKGTVMFAWRRAASGPPLAAQGYDVVMTPGQPYYLNTALADSWWEPGSGFYGSASLEATYDLDPFAGFAPGDTPRVIGVQACIWTLLIDRPGIFERLVFPRLSAVAETGWSDPRSKDLDRFRRASRLLPTL
jgi:hexosaminidase